MNTADHLLWAGVAASAAGMELHAPTKYIGWQCWYRTDREGAEYFREWEPHKKNAESFELAALLGLNITHYPIYTPEKHSIIVYRAMDLKSDEKNPYEFCCNYGADKMAAIRQAVLVVASQIGQASGQQLSTIFRALPWEKTTA